MCDCGATDCPECGPAQGYRVVRGRHGWYNPEDEDEDLDIDESEDIGNEE